MILDFIPTVVLFLHLIIVVLALALVLSTDFRFLFSRSSTVDIDKIGHYLFWLMLGLWSTGLLLIYLRTGFAASNIVSNSKLIMKLLCVSVLSINGYLLHRYSFKILTKREPMTRREALTLSATGAISTSHWLLAMFVGIAHPLKQYSLQPLLILYLASLCALGLIAISLSPFIKTLINSERAQILLIQMGLGNTSHTGHH